MRFGNEKRKLNKKLRSLVIKTAVLAVVITGVLAAYVFGTLSWFINSTKTNLSGNTLSSVDAEYATVKMYQYYVDTDGNANMSETSSIETDMWPGDKIVFIIIAENKYSDAITFTTQFTDFSVRFYALQHFSDRTLLDAYIEPYMYAGPYTKTVGGVTSEYYYENMTSDDYLSFISPASNAIKVRSVTMSVDPTATGGLTVPEYAKSLLEGASPAVTFSGDGTPLFSTAKRYSPSVFLDNAETEWLPLYDGTDGIHTADGTAYAFPNQNVPYACFGVYYFELTFDRSVLSSSTLDTDADGTADTAVTCMRCDPYMYQNIKVGTIRFSTSK